jgi:tetraacyldisaccharide 4'-kinase
MNPLRYLFLPITVVYGGIVTVRNLLYQNNVFKSSSFDMPIICVGNLSMGGTGKTPHTEMLIRLLQDEYKVATLSRGYGRKTADFQLANPESSANTIGDEPFQYYRKFPKIKVAVEKKRVLGVLFILNKEEETDVILLDDAFQHRSLAAGMNILLTDFKKPFFEDQLLPIGELREAKKGSKRADIVIVTKCPDELSEKELRNFYQNIPLEKDAIFFTKIVYKRIYRGIDFKELDGPLADYEVLLVTGIAKPKPIETYLKNQNVKFEALHFGDHHRFSKKDVAAISKKFDTFTHSKKIILTTEKDFARMLVLKEFSELPIFCLEIEVEFLRDKELFDNKVLEYVRANKRDSEIPTGENEL